MSSTGQPEYEGTIARVQAEIAIGPGKDGGPKYHVVSRRDAGMPPRRGAPELSPLFPTADAARVYAEARTVELLREAVAQAEAAPLAQDDEWDADDEPPF